VLEGRAESAGVRRARAHGMAIATLPRQRRIATNRFFAEEHAMLPIHTILHPTDFSERSGYAFRLACSLARDYKAHLIALHVLPPPVIAYGEGIVPVPVDPECLEALKAEFERLHLPCGQLSVEHRLAEGDPATEILRTAQEIACDLIVMGTHGRTGLGRVLLGSVAEEVVRKATSPVLTVKTPLVQEPVTEEEQPDSVAELMQSA
jgi:nucleotide-binding universal stress UspA family protein